MTHIGQKFALRLIGDLRRSRHCFGLSRGRQELLIGCSQTRIARFQFSRAFSYLFFDLSVTQDQFPMAPIGEDGEDFVLVNICADGVGGARR